MPAAPGAKWVHVTEEVKAKLVELSRKLDLPQGTLVKLLLELLENIERNEYDRLVLVFKKRPIIVDVFPWKRFRELAKKATLCDYKSIFGCTKPPEPSKWEEVCDEFTYLLSVHGLYRIAYEALTGPSITELSRLSKYLEGEVAWLLLGMCASRIMEKSVPDKASAPTHLKITLHDILPGWFLRWFTWWMQQRRDWVK